MVGKDELLFSEEIADFLFVSDQISRSPGAVFDWKVSSLPEALGVRVQDFSPDTNRNSQHVQSRDLVNIAALSDLVKFGSVTDGGAVEPITVDTIEVARRFDQLRDLVNFAEKHFGAVPLYRPGDGQEVFLPAYDVFDEHNHATLERLLGEALPRMAPAGPVDVETYSQALAEFPGIVWEGTPDIARKNLFRLVSADIVAVARIDARGTDGSSGSSIAALTAPVGTPPGTPPPPSSSHIWFDLTTNTPGIQVVWWWWGSYGAFTPMNTLTSTATNQISQYLHAGNVGFSTPNLGSPGYIDDPNRHAVGPANPDASTTSPTAF